MEETDPMRAAAWAAVHALEVSWRSSRLSVFVTASAAALWLVLLGACALPAMAAAPEEPVTESASTVTATSATVHGELNPGASAIAGFEFTYNTNGTCSEGFTTEPGSEATGKGLKVSSLLSGLEPNREYTFCVVATHLEGETTESTSGPPSTFKTLALPPVIDSEAASAVGATEATLEAQVNPNDEETNWSFSYATNPGLTGATTLAGALPAEFGDRTASAATGAVLTPGTTYYYRVSAENEQSKAESKPVLGSVESFTTLAVPILGSPKPVSAVTSTTATLLGAVNPDGAQITSCQFEYRTETEAEGFYGYIVPCAPAPGAGSAPAPVTAELSGLVSGDTYHYRLVATNANGTTADQDATFTTSAEPFAGIAPPPIFSSVRGLPDGRVYEQVSPTNKSGNAVAEYGIASGENRSLAFGFAAADGEAVMYFGKGALAPESASGNLNQLFVSQRTSAGWVTRSAMPIGAPGPSTDPELNSGIFVNELGQMEVSADLSHLAFSSGPAADVGPPDAEGLADNFYLAGPDPFAEPEWPSRSDPTGGGSVVAVGGSPDLSTIYFESSGLLGPSASGFYEYRDGVLSDAGALPEGQVSPSGASPAVSGGGPSEDADSNVVSADGSHAFFVREDPAGVLELYVHLTTPDGAQSSELVSRSGMSGKEGEPAPDGVAAMPTTEWYTGEFGNHVGSPSYVHASSDGSSAFFQSIDRLTASAPAGVAPKVYKLDLHTGVLEYLPGVVGSIASVADDGSSLLFENTAVSPYELDRWSAGAQGGTVSPIAQLSSSGPCSLVCVSSVRTSRDGLIVVFTTEAPIAGFNDEGGFKQVFRYDAGSDELGCVSCPPRGVTPTGSASMSNANEALNEAGGTGGSGGIKSVSDDRGVTPNGDLVFFDTPDALVPQDRNGVRDVYEWEDGEVFLLSSGQSPRGATFMDSSESGDDVFIATAESLVAGDTDGAIDAYDVRVPRPGDVPLPSAVPCQGDVCQGPPSVPQLLDAPFSATFDGVGNLAPELSPARAKPKALTNAQKLAAALKVCRRQPQRKRSRCESQARSKYSTSKAKSHKKGK
jgi:hypothetical protein